jgi:hypothetical protein
VWLEASASLPTQPALQDVRSELLGWVARENREVLGLLAILYFSKSFGRHAALEQLAYRRCSARHPFCKTPRINDPQLCVCEHDLEPFASIEFTHLTPPVKKSLLKRNKPKMRSLPLILINLPFRFWPVGPERRPMR